MFRKTNRDREIGHDRIFRIVLARISIKPGWKIDGEDESIFFAPQTINLARGGAEWFSQKRFCPGAKQAIQNNDLRRVRDCLRRPGGRIAQRF